MSPSEKVIQNRNQNLFIRQIYNVHRNLIWCCSATAHQIKVNLVETSKKEVVPLKKIYTIEVGYVQNEMYRMSGYLPANESFVSSL